MDRNGKGLSPNETIQLYHRSGSRLNEWSEKGTRQDDGRPYHTSDTLDDHKVSIRRSRSVYRIRTKGADQTAVVAPAEGKEIEDYEINEAPRRLD